jgi:hypothetical protein
MIAVVVLQGKHNSESRVNAVHLVETEITHAAIESTGIDRRGLFRQHPREAAVDLDFGPKACGSG